MMYSDKLAVAIKVDGKVLREHGDTVYLPIGCEYSVFIKNMDTRRAAVSITIDGTDILDGRSLVVEAGCTSEVERFVRNGNLSEGNRLRFIEKTASIEKHRGNRVEDGLVEIGWQFEALPLHQIIDTTLTRPRTDCPIKPYSGFGGHGLDEPNYTVKNCGNVSDVVRPVPADCSVQATSSPCSNVSGITVAGSESQQKFSTTVLGRMDQQRHSMVVRLMGGDAPIGQVIKPVTVKTKLTCSSCGTKSKSTVKFCPECGTSLHLT
jgi:hypothetical protein